MPRTALIVPVPEAEPLVHEWRIRYDDASRGIPAHVTLLFPFVPTDDIEPALIAELRALFATQPGFSFSLARVARFPEVAWLSPEPTEPFRRLTELIVSHYPNYPPYEGAYDKVIPHLTVGVGEPALQDEIDAALTPHLPIAAEAREVTLLVEDGAGQWHSGSRFSLER